MESKEKLEKICIEAMKDKSVEEQMKIVSLQCQLEKDLEMLEILKKNIEIVDTDFVDEDGDDIFKIQLKPLNISMQQRVKEWLER